MQISMFFFTAGAGCETFRTSKSYFKKKEDVWIPEFSSLRSSGGTLTIHISFTIQTINPHLQKPKTAFKPLLPAFPVGFLKLSSFASCSFVVNPPIRLPKFLHHHCPLKKAPTSQISSSQVLLVAKAFVSLDDFFAGFFMTAKADRSSLGRTLWNGTWKLSCHSP